MFELGILGAGNMGAAIAKGILNKGVYRPEELIIYDINPAALDVFTEMGVTAAESEAQVVSQSRLVLFAIKPQGFRDLLSKIAPVCKPDNVFVSIAAGISADFIKRELGYDAKVVLVMPNTPILLGYGASALSRVSPTTDEEFAMAMALFSASGVAVEVKPEQMCGVIPIHGSSPAMFYHIAQVFVREAEQYGIAPEIANRLVCQTMVGAAAMMLQTGKTHQELIDMVSSKGGTTLAMRAAMDDCGFENALAEGFEACIRRAEELGQ